MSCLVLEPSIPSGNQPQVKNKTIGVTALGLQALGLSALGLSALGLSGTNRFNYLNKIWYHSF